MRWRTVQQELITGASAEKVRKKTTATAKLFRSFGKELPLHDNARADLSLAFALRTSRDVTSFRHTMSIEGCR